MKLLAAVLVGYFGYRLGRIDLQLRPAQALVTISVAAALHMFVQHVLRHEAIDGFASAVATWWKVALIPVALLETAGMWIPVLTIPWAGRESRIAAAAFVMSGATLEILSFHMPFCVHFINGERIGPTHPEYLLGLLFSLVLAIIPFGIGRYRSSRPWHRPSLPVSTLMLGGVSLLTLLIGVGFACAAVGLDGRPDDVIVEFDRQFTSGSTATAICVSSAVVLGAAGIFCLLRLKT